MRSLSLFIVADSVWKWIRHLGGPGLILLGLADNTSFISAPTGSGDVFLSVPSAHQHEWWAYYAFMATVGEGAGGYTQSGVGSDEGPRSGARCEAPDVLARRRERCAARRPERWRETIPRRHVNHQ